MVNEEHGRTAAPADARLLVIDGDGVAYGVPPEVMERHRVPPERRAQIDARRREATATGAAIPADAPLYELPAEAVAPYRLPDEQRAAAEAQRGDARDDAQGHGQFIGVFPGWVMVEPPAGGAAARRSQIHTYDAAFWFNSGGGSSRYGPYPGLR